MQTTLTTIGSELALILDRSLVDSLRLGPDRLVEVELRADSLVVRAAPSKPDPIREAFQHIVEHPEELQTGAFRHSGWGG